MKDNIRDRLLYAMETIIAQFDAEILIFLYDIDLTLEILFKITSELNLRLLYWFYVVAYENIRLFVCISKLMEGNLIIAQKIIHTKR